MRTALFALILLLTALFIATARANDCTAYANYAAQVTNHRLNGRTLPQTLVWLKPDPSQRFVIETVYMLKLRPVARPRVIHEVRSAFYQLCTHTNARNP